MLPFIGFGQKKANGTIYIEHPAIKVVDAFTKAMVNGDTTAMSKLMTSDFKSFNPVRATPFDQGRSKTSFLRGAKWMHENLDYFNIKTMEGAYPDAFEYTKDPSDNNAYTVESWDVLKGVHKKTGVKIDQFLHRSFTLTKDNKIRRLMTYNNPEKGTAIGSAYSERKNGTIYNEHDNINMLRIMMGAIENGDYGKYYSYFDPKATFQYSNDPDLKSVSLDETKASNKAFFEKFDIKGIQQVGYPDFLQYEMGNTGGKWGTLLSWWNIHFIRKSDKKEIKVRFHFSHNVNADGKIEYELAYFNADLLK